MFYIFSIFICSILMSNALHAKEPERDVQAIERGIAEQKERTARFTQQKDIEDVVNKVMQESKTENRNIKDRLMTLVAQTIKKEVETPVLKSGAKDLQDQLIEQFEGLNDSGISDKLTQIENDIRNYQEKYIAQAEQREAEHQEMIAKRKHLSLDVEYNKKFIDAGPEVYTSPKEFIDSYRSRPALSDIKKQKLMQLAKKTTTGGEIILTGKLDPRLKALYKVLVLQGDGLAESYVFFENINKALRKEYFDDIVNDYILVKLQKSSIVYAVPKTGGQIYSLSAKKHMVTGADEAELFEIVKVLQEKGLVITREE